MTMTNTAVAAPRAGWYQDPRDEQSWRWWDGDAWTTHTQSKAPVAPSLSTLPFPVAASPTMGSTVTYADTASGSSSGKVRFADGTYGSWNEIESAQTLGAWMLAFGPILWPVLLGVVGIGVWFATEAGIPSIVTMIGACVVVFGVPWLVVGQDARALKRRGYQPASVLWLFLLPPLIYLIMRGRAVVRDGGSGWPPLIAYLITYGVLTIAGLLVSASAATFVQLVQSYVNAH